MADSEAPVAPLVEQKSSAAVKVQRIKKPERPERSALDATIASLQEKIAANTSRVSEIKQILDGKQNSKDASKKDVQVVRTQLMALSVQSSDAMHQRNFLRDDLAAADAARKRMKDEARTVRASLKFTKMEDLNAKIQQLEHEMSHTTMDFAEEKKLAKEVKLLEQSKAAVREYTARLDRIAEEEAGREEQTKKIREKEDEVTALKKQENALKDVIRKMRDADSSEHSDFRDLIDERQGKYDVVSGLRKEIDAARSGFRKQMDEFQEQQAIWLAQQQETRKREYEEREAMRRERDARRKAWEEENYVEPYTDEIFICDQLTSYLQKLTGAGSTEGVASEAKDAAAKPKTQTVAPAGFGNALVSKKDREDEEGGLFGGMGGKKGKGKGPKPKPVKLMLSLDLLQSFGKISVPHPVSVAEVPETVEKVKVAKSGFVELQLGEREKRAAAKAAEAAKANGLVSESEEKKVAGEGTSEGEGVIEGLGTGGEDAEAPVENGEGEAKVEDDDSLVGETSLDEQSGAEAAKEIATEEVECKANGDGNGVSHEETKAQEA